MANARKLNLAQVEEMRVNYQARTKARLLIREGNRLFRETPSLTADAKRMGIAYEAARRAVNGFSYKVKS